MKTLFSVAVELLHVDEAEPTDPHGAEQTVVAAILQTPGAIADDATVRRFVAMPGLTLVEMTDIDAVVVRVLVGVLERVVPPAVGHEDVVVIDVHFVLDLHDRQSRCIAHLADQRGVTLKEQVDAVEPQVVR